MTWLWIPLTIGAALLQSLRSAVQRHLTRVLSTNGATFTRFAYGLPLAVLYILLLTEGLGATWPVPRADFWLWTVTGSLSQILATSLLLLVFRWKNFAVGIAYSKTEVVQAALFGLVFLGEHVTWLGALAILLGTVGVMLFSLKKDAHPLRAFLTGWLERPALLGLVSAALFGVSAVGFRAASLSLGHESALVAAGFTLACSAAIQTAVMTLYLRLREPGQITQVLRHWRLASLSGLTGIVGSAGWFTAMTLQQVAYVRTLGLIEMLFTFAIAVLFFKEHPRRAEILGIVLLVSAIALVLNVR
jgi:drug/metabolite transporter (DMT)-like permease